MKIQKLPRGWSAEKKWRGFVYPINGHFDWDYKISPICEIFHKSAYYLLIFYEMLVLAFYYRAAPRELLAAQLGIWVVGLLAL